VTVHLLGLVTIGLGMVIYVLGAEICCADGRLRPGAASGLNQVPESPQVEEARA
jgi:hypothetical protein